MITLCFRNPNSHIPYLLDIDRRAKYNPRFLAKEDLPGLAYLKPDAYKEHFGILSGRWLVVTTGKRHMVIMLRHAKKAESKGLFYLLLLTKSFQRT